MNVLATALVILAVYVFINLAAPIIFLPDMLLKRRITSDMLREVKKEIGDTLEGNKTRKQVLEGALKLQLSNFYSSMGNMYTHLGRMLESDFPTLWKEKGFAHCHNQCFILRRLLLASGRFSEEDIRYKLSICYVMIHQYAEVNVSDDRKHEEWIRADPFAMSLGFRLGEVLPFNAYPEIKRRGLRTTGRAFRKP